MTEKPHTPALNTTILMAAIMVTQFMSAFMGASVNIALPQIAADFEMSATGSSWVVMSFLLSTGMFLLPFGRIGDMVGRKRIFLSGIIIFTMASLLCAVSFSGFMLVASRFVQGIGGAMMMSTAMAIITAVFPPQKRGRMLGLAVSAVYLGLTVAPVLGGVMTKVLGWHSIFYTGFGFGIVITLAVFFKVKAEWKEDMKDHFDFAGSVIYIISVFLFMFGFSRLPGAGGIIMSAAGVTGLACFVWFESRIAAPVLNISLFTGNRVFAFSNLAALINYAATFAIGFILSLYLQYARGFEPHEAGLLLITQPAVMALTASYAGRLSDRIDPRKLASLGMGIIVVGLVLLCFLKVDGGHAYLVATLIIVGLGFGVFSSPNTNAVMGSVAKTQLGVASATVSTMRVLGQIMSMAMTAMIFRIFLGNEKVTEQNLVAFVQSSRVLFIIFAILCFAGVFASLARGKQNTAV